MNSLANDISAEDVQSPGRIYTILMVDDDPAFAQLCKRYLKKSRQWSMTVHLAPNATAGLRLYESNQYDCLILDYHLPETTGTQLLQKLHKISEEDTVPPAIVLTASTGQDAAVDAIRSEAMDFMAKSDVTPTALCSAIDNACSKAQLRDELRDKHVHLEQTFVQLKKKNEEITRFYHTVSHEVKTPLTAMLEFLQLLNDETAGPVNDDQRELIVYTHECCDTISQHFDDLLEVTRFDTGKLTLSLGNFQLNEVVTLCVKGAQGRARAKGIDLEQQDAIDMPAVMLDKRRIQQVLGNLLDNAIKFTPPGGKITATTRYEQSVDSVQISVCDTGCGIRQQFTDKIFDRLYQVSEGSDFAASPDGLGLGLSISKEIVDAHKGSISMQSEPGVGTTFTVSLPANQH